MKNYKERVNAAYEKAEAATKNRSPITLKVAALATRVKVTAQTHTRAFVISCVASAFACLLIVFALVLFVPYSVYPVNLSRYKKSEYYDLIEKISEINYGRPWYTTNFEQWFPKNIKHGATLPPPSDEQEVYKEVTDNQVEGVIEGDLFKRSDKYIYYLSQSHGIYDKIYLTLEIYSCDAENSTKVSSLEIPCEESFNFYDTTTCEIYLSTDCKTVTVFAPVYDSLNRIYLTEIIKINVSDLSDLKITNKLFVSGLPSASRLYNGEFILITRFSLRRYPDFDNEKQFVPQTGTLDDMQSLPLDNIIRDGKLNTSRYTVVCTINENLLVDSCYAFLSYSDAVYVSQSNIYTVKNLEADGKSCISRLTYDGGKIDYIGTANVDGTVLNQYSMDERESVMRVATTTGSGRETSASVHCIDINTFEIIGSLENFAPVGEAVQSVRFDGNTAFVCTAKTVELTDPVFAIDLSDPKNIAFKDTGTIPGYSISLTKFYCDTLLGIGYDGSRQLKIEIYEEETDRVTPIASYVKDYVSNYTKDGIEYYLHSNPLEFSEDYKSHFIDAQNGYIGLAVFEDIYYNGRDENGKIVCDFFYCGSVYLLLKFDGENLTVINEITLKIHSYELSYTRATIIDDYLYVLCNEGLQVVKVGE